MDNRKSGNSEWALTLSGGGTYSAVLIRQREALARALHNKQFFDEKTLLNLDRSRGADGKYQVSTSDPVMLSNVKAILNLMSDVANVIPALSNVFDYSQTEGWIATTIGLSRLAYQANANYRDFSVLYTDYQALLLQIEQTQHLLSTIPSIEFDINDFLKNMKLEFTETIQPIINAFQGMPGVTISTDSQVTTVIKTKKTDAIITALTQAEDNIERIKYALDEMSIQANRNQLADHYLETIDTIKLSLTAVNSAIAKTKSSVSGDKIYSVAIISDLGNAFKALQSINYDHLSSEAQSDIKTFLLSTVMPLQPVISQIVVANNIAESRLGLNGSITSDLVKQFALQFESVVTKLDGSQTLISRYPYHEEVLIANRNELARLGKLKEDYSSIKYRLLADSKKIKDPTTSVAELQLIKNSLENVHKMETRTLITSIENLIAEKTGLTTLNADIVKLEGNILKQPDQIHKEMAQLQELYVKRDDILIHIDLDRGNQISGLYPEIQIDNQKVKKHIDQQLIQSQIIEKTIGDLDASILRISNETAILKQRTKDTENSVMITKDPTLNELFELEKQVINLDYSGAKAFTDIDSLKLNAVKSLSLSTLDSFVVAISMIQSSSPSVAMAPVSTGIYAYVTPVTNYLLGRKQSDVATSDQTYYVEFHKAKSALLHEIQNKRNIAVTKLNAELPPLAVITENAPKSKVRQPHVKETEKELLARLERQNGSAVKTTMSHTRSIILQQAKSLLTQENFEALTLQNANTTQLTYSANDTLLVSTIKNVLNLLNSVDDSYTKIYEIYATDGLLNKASALINAKSALKSLETDIQNANKQIQQLANVESQSITYAEIRMILNAGEYALSTIPQIHGVNDLPKLIPPNVKAKFESTHLGTLANDNQHQIIKNLAQIKDAPSKANSMIKNMVMVADNKTARGLAGIAADSYQLITLLKNFDSTQISNLRKAAGDDIAKLASTLRESTANIELSEIRLGIQSGTLINNPLAAYDYINQVMTDLNLSSQHDYYSSDERRSALVAAAAEDENTIRILTHLSSQLVSMNSNPTTTLTALVQLRHGLQQLPIIIAEPTLNAINQEIDMALGTNDLKHEINQLSSSLRTTDDELLAQELRLIDLTTKNNITESDYQTITTLNDKIRALPAYAIMDSLSSEDMKVIYEQYTDQLMNENNARYISYFNKTPKTYEEFTQEAMLRPTLIKDFTHQRCQLLAIKSGILMSDIESTKVKLNEVKTKINSIKEKIEERKKVESEINKILDDNKIPPTRYLNDKRLVISSVDTIASVNIGAAIKEEIQKSLTRYQEQMKYKDNLIRLIDEQRLAHNTYTDHVDRSALHIIFDQIEKKENLKPGSLNLFITNYAKLHLDKQSSLNNQAYLATIMLSMLGSENPRKKVVALIKDNRGDKLHSSLHQVIKKKSTWFGRAIRNLLNIRSTNDNLYYLSKYFSKADNYAEFARQSDRGVMNEQVNGSTSMLAARLASGDALKLRVVENTKEVKSGVEEAIKPSDKPEVRGENSPDRTPRLR